MNFLVSGFGVDPFATGQAEAVTSDQPLNTEDTGVSEHTDSSVAKDD